MTEQQYYWGEINRERLTALSLDEAVGDYLESLETVEGIATFVQWRPMMKDGDWRWHNVLDQLLEVLDENFAMNEQAEATHASESMRAAEEVFVTAIMSEYRVQDYEPINSTKVDVNLPEWVEIQR